METNRIREFVMLVECGGFRTAAKELFISQATLSRHIAELETSTGRLLVIRRNPVTLTPSGIVFEHYARQLIALCDQFRKDLSSVDDNTTYRIKVQDISSNAQLAAMFASIRQILKEKLIGAHFEFAPPPSHSVIEAVASNSIDIGMIKTIMYKDEVLMPRTDSVDFVSLSALRQPLSACCRRTSPFDKLAAINAQDLLSARLIASSVLSPYDTERSLEMLVAHLSGMPENAPKCCSFSLPLEYILERADDNAIILSEASTAALLPERHYDTFSLKATGLKDYRMGVCLVMRKNWKELAERMRDEYHLF